MGSTDNQGGQGDLIGIPMALPEGCERDVSMILRAIIAMAVEFNCDDTELLIKEGEPYEVLARRLIVYRRNVVEVADRIKEVTGYNH